ncbi:MAG: hypothetical protein V4726_12525 [Verrucomicrobiota bacterium]
MITKVFRMGEAEFPALKHEIVVPANAHHPLRRHLREPVVNIFQRPGVILLKAAHVAAVDQQIAGRWACSAVKFFRAYKELRQRARSISSGVRTLI